MTMKAADWNLLVVIGVTIALAALSAVISAGLHRRAGVRAADPLWLGVSWLVVGFIGCLAIAGAAAALDERLRLTTVVLIAFLFGVAVVLLLSVLVVWLLTPDSAHVARSRWIALIPWVSLCVLTFGLLIAPLWLHARAMEQRVVCASTLRQLALIMQMYADENKGWTTTDAQALGKYVGGAGNAAKLSACPISGHPYQLAKPRWLGRRQTSIALAWDTPTAHAEGGNAAYFSGGSFEVPKVLWLRTEELIAIPSGEPIAGQH